MKTPWYKFYGSEKEHLEYPDFSAYKLIEYTASKHLNNISYNYYGNKKTYHEFLKQIDDILEAYSLGRIDFIEPRYEDGEPDFDGEYKLIINDKTYKETGWELLVLKWIEGHENTGYVVECMID